MSQGRRQPMDVRKVRPPTAPAAKPNPFAKHGMPAPGTPAGAMLQADAQGKVLPGMGRLPLPTGTMIPTNKLTKAEQEFFDKMEWKPGDPVPASLPDMIAQIKAESEPADDELPPGVDPSHAPIRPKMVDFAQLPPEKQQELVHAMHAAKAQAERIANMPRIDGANPGVNDALAAAHGMGGPEVVLRKEQPARPRQAPQPPAQPIDINRRPGDLRIKTQAPQAPLQVNPSLMGQWADSAWATPQVLQQRQAYTGPPEQPQAAHCHVPPQPELPTTGLSFDEEQERLLAEQQYVAEEQRAMREQMQGQEPEYNDSGAAINNCPHCGYDLAQPHDDVQVDRADKMAFLMATLGAPHQRFKKSVDLLGGRIKVVFRTLTTSESDQIRTQMRHDVANSRFAGPGGQWNAVVSMAEYRLAASLDSIEYPGMGRSQSVPVLDDIEPDEGQPTGLPNLVRYVNEQLLTQEYLRTSASRSFAVFQLQVEKLEVSMDNPDFWEGIEGQP